MDTTEIIITIVFIVWGIPLSTLRTRFRKAVYKTNSWTIAIKPVFVKETYALFGCMDMKDNTLKQLARIYRLYLSIYVTLLFAYLWLV